MIVPAKMTWLLQPLDTDAFSRYKQYSAIFPNRLEVPSNELFYPFLPCPPVLPRAPLAADTAAADADPAPWPDRLRSWRSSSALALLPAASASSSAEPLQLPEVDGLPPEPEAAGPLAAVPQAPRGYRLPAARRQPSWRSD